MVFLPYLAFTSNFINNLPILLIALSMSDQAKSQQKTYHKRATGAALNTVKKHSKDHDLKLFGSCFWYAHPP